MFRIRVKSYSRLGKNLDPNSECRPKFQANPTPNTERIILQIQNRILLSELRGLLWIRRESHSKFVADQGPSDIRRHFYYGFGENSTHNWHKSSSELGTNTCERIPLLARSKVFSGLGDSPIRNLLQISLLIRGEFYSEFEFYSVFGAYASLNSVLMLLYSIVNHTQDS